MSDTLLKSKGMQVLREYLGIVEAERFIHLIIKDNFDYTKWQRDLWKDKSVDEICDAANSYLQLETNSDR